MPKTKKHKHKQNASPKRKFSIKKTEVPEAKENTVLTGKGRFVFQDGSSYSGEWKDCGDGKKIKHGKGILKTVSGVNYEGEWKDDSKHGKATCQYPTGNFYEGDFDCGKFEGKGKFSWISGATYSGEWKSGFMHGQGLFVDSEGNSFMGQFSEGKFVNSTGYVLENQEMEDKGSDPFNMTEYVPRQIGNIYQKIKWTFIKPLEGDVSRIPLNNDEDMSEIYRNNANKETVDSLSRSFSVALKLPQQVWEVCQSAPGGGVSYIVLYTWIYNIIKGENVSDPAILANIETAMKQYMEKSAIGLSASEKIYLYHAMAASEDKEIRSKGIAELKAIANSSEISEKVKNKVKYLQEHASKCVKTTQRHNSTEAASEHE
mmetsp:Transcript_7960/g.14754  ORF Transcript_7960/g.14754 Transcript_7960/m.14754 type:complete len:373 (-) Transcript_7960:235-1353(-)|eukprot:CAMPEP_0197528548 /NCGR_PEP_ID=MMETSP1318-20131121/25459_1 /TAXON_ID=552666 /ORGANISM="Partenskyella glossopodia, Strain RCC365" /LENGTH=372 /DNA_ID=CAMNT_0043083685 /DNA_START=150 /DNA_END=1268 /DNA_ORIENTATION=-